MNKMKIFNLVYKINKAKTEKSCAVDSLKMAYILKKRLSGVASFITTDEQLQ